MGPRHSFDEVDPRGPTERPKRWRTWRCSRCGLTASFTARTDPHRVGLVGCDEQVVRSVMEA